jgi:hypothetical protein
MSLIGASEPTAPVGSRATRTLVGPWHAVQMEEVWTCREWFPITDIGNLRRAPACCGFDMKKQRVNRSLSKGHPAGDY